MTTIDLQHMTPLAAEALKRAINGEEVLLSDHGKPLGKIIEVVKIEDNEPLTERRAGALQGFLEYMADDFNEPLEDFKDYMPK